MNAVASTLANGAVLSVFLTITVWLVLRIAPRHFLNAATRNLVWWIVLAITIALPALQLPVQLRTLRPAQISLQKCSGAQIVHMLPQSRLYRWKT
jgi:hypothetical protein